MFDPSKTYGVALYRPAANGFATVFKANGERLNEALSTGFLVNGVADTPGSAASLYNLAHFEHVEIVHAE